MNILITGASGFIGNKLCRALKKHHLTLLTRDPNKITTADNIKVITSLNMYGNLNDFDAVINLAGEPIFKGRWSESKKKRIFSSRIDLTRQLATLVNYSNHAPHTFISASASGIYGDQKNKYLTEETVRKNESFTHYVCSHWEEAALQANTRVCLLRTGIVLGKGGVLQNMRLPLRLGLGIYFGNGKQFMPWIHIEDEIRAILFLLKHQTLKGAFNLSAPQIITNKEFCHAFHQSICFPIPECILKIGLGEASHLLLDSQRISPSKLKKAGFEFNYPDIKSALCAIFQEKP